MAPLMGAAFASRWRRPKRQAVAFAVVCCALLLAVGGGCRLASAVAPPTLVPRQYQTTEPWRRRPSWMVATARASEQAAGGGAGGGGGGSGRRAAVSEAPGWWPPTVRAIKTLWPESSPAGVETHGAGRSASSPSPSSRAVASQHAALVPRGQGAGRLGGRLWRGAKHWAGGVAKAANCAAEGVGRWWKSVGSLLTDTRRRLVDAAIDIEWDAQWPQLSLLTPRAACVASAGLPLSRGRGCVRM